MHGGTLNLSKYKLVKLFSNLRVPAGWIFFLLVIIVGEIRNYWPLFFVVLGEIIRTTASGTIIKNEKLSTAGLYSIVRHPLYLGSLFINLGFCLICNNPVLWVYSFILFPACYYSAIAMEEITLNKKFGIEFLNYKKNVPAFLPIKFKKLRMMKNNFSWSLVFRNKEYNNWFILLAVILLILLKSVSKSQ